jgi:hypothetical protein
MIGARTVKAQFFAVPYFCSLSKESPANQYTMHLLDRFSRIGLGLGAVCAGFFLMGLVWLGFGDDHVLSQSLKRRAHGRELRLEHHMALGFERAAWAGLIVGGAGVVTLGWWGRREVGGGRRVAAGWVRAPIPWRAVVVAGGLSMVVSAGLRGPRLGHSFWTDEAYAARAYVWGVNERADDGGMVHRPVAWSRALFLNERSNNHLWCTVEARVAHWVWRVVGGHAGTEFSEVAMRMPAFIWGVGTVGATTLLGAMLAGRGGLAAGLLLGVHPWHVRFATEMRGYSAMLLALVLGLIFLRQALSDGRWRWWLLTAAMNLWALLAFAGSLYFPLVTCGLAACWLVRVRCWTWLSRLVLANALAGVCFLWIYGPSLSQLSEYLRRGNAVSAYRVTAGWLGQLGESLCLGVPWSVMSLEWREVAWVPSATVAGWATAAVAGLLVLRVAAWSWWCPRLLLGPTLLGGAAALMIGQSVAMGTLLLMWYLLPVLLGLVLLLGICPDPWAAEVVGRGQRAMLAGGQAVTAAVCLVVWTGSSLAMGVLPRQPMRDAARVEGAPEGSLQAVVGISDQQMKLYVPDVMVVKSAADLEVAERAAAREGKSLLVKVGGWEATRERLPEVVARLRGDGYETLADFSGWEPMFGYRVLQKRPMGLRKRP